MMAGVSLPGVKPLVDLKEEVRHQILCCRQTLLSQVTPP